MVKEKGLKVKKKSNGQINVKGKKCPDVKIQNQREKRIVKVKGQQEKKGNVKMIILALNRDEVCKNVL